MSMLSLDNIEELEEDLAEKLETLEEEGGLDKGLLSTTLFKDFFAELQLIREEILLRNKLPTDYVVTQKTSNGFMVTFQASTPKKEIQDFKSVLSDQAWVWTETNRDNNGDILDKTYLFCQPDEEVPREP